MQTMHGYDVGNQSGAHITFFFQHEIQMSHLNLMLEFVLFFLN